MKIIGPVVLVLIAGILTSSTNADQDTDDTLKSVCNKYGGPQAYNVVQNFLTNAKVFIASLIREIQQAYTNSSDGIDAAITLYCSKVEILQNNTNRLVRVMRPCRDPRDRELAGASNFIDLLLEFPCANRNLLKDVFNSTDLPCFGSKNPAVMNCTLQAQAFRDDAFKKLSLPEIDSDEVLPVLEPGVNNITCSHLQTFEQCSVRAFAECEDKLFSTIMDSWYKYANIALPCENLAKTPRQENITA